MLNIMQPFYDYNTDMNLGTIFSPDSGSLILMPTLTYTFSGNFVAKASYMGMFDLYKNSFTEVTELPLKHMVNCTFTYSF